MKNSRVKAKLRRNRIIALFIGAAVIFFCVLMAGQIISSNKSNKDQEARRARLEELIEAQEQRAAELDDEEEYIKTREYIEEKAKSIGYVFPDEIIFKRED
ncbi:MAG: septum formation initiator family protein [Parasporobacterium sp.]|nr:septum formation initiator family protein [Parasporobacterium sp.]